MPEGLAPISSSRVSTGDISRHSFAIVRRGFDADEVRSYLQSVARSIEAFEQRELELRAAVAEAEERAAHPTIDESTLTASLGQHSAQILRHAHEEAARIVAQAQEGAASLLRDTQAQVDELQARHEASSAERVVEVELLVANAEQEARAEGDRIMSEAVAQGEEVIARAKDEGRALLEQVQEARRRVLADLTTRRKALSIQIEQLRAARDEMAASVTGVRQSVDDILAQLQRTDDEARAAALAAGDQARIHGTFDDPGPGEEAPPIEAPEAASEDDGTAAAAPSVDELFARIRAGTDTDAPQGDATAPVAVMEAEVGTVDAPSAAAEPDPLTSRRDELLAPIAAQLTRHIKRALGDDQNRLLDVLRSAPSTQGEALLGSEDEHLAAYTSAAQGHLLDAFKAGAVFAGQPEGGAVAGGSVEQTASGLARTVVTMLRRRIEDGSDEPGERVGAAFREWRGERIERLVGDFAVQSFSAGTVAALTPSGKMRWVLTSAQGCSDCDDNALAGAVAASEGFPTGHPYPPAHSGCRCLVTPT
ncbi:MAG TPA: DivIVA domain-containing protein [Acidimicrobiales bacterium]|jgi:DivIVA domain-containing protein